MSIYLKGRERISMKTKPEMKKAKNRHWGNPEFHKVIF